MNRFKNIQRVVKWIFMLLILNIGFANQAEAQKKKHKAPRNPQKEAMKKEQDREKAIEAAEEKGRKRHKKLQEKPVRKRMKQSHKRARRNDLGRRDPFFKRVFSRKKRKK